MTGKLLFKVKSKTCIVDLLHVILFHLNALLPSVMQIVNGFGEIVAWDVKVDRAADFAFKTISVLEDAATKKLLQVRKQSKIGRCEIERVRRVGEKLEVKSLNGFNRALRSMRSRVVVQE